MHIDPSNYVHAIAARSVILFFSFHYSPPALLSTSRYHGDNRDIIAADPTIIAILKNTTITALMSLSLSNVVLTDLEWPHNQFYFVGGLET